jgi:hypothetical protein
MNRKAVYKRNACCSCQQRVYRRVETSDICMSVSRETTYSEKFDADALTVNKKYYIFGSTILHVAKVALDRNCHRT